MAVKNREMDSILAESAMREFLTCGFNDASLRRIADAAGTTTGSIYMRYANKDRLFCSLTECIVEETEKAFEELKPLYAACKTPDDLVKAAEAESDRILRSAESALYGSSSRWIILAATTLSNASAG